MSGSSGPPVFRASCGAIGFALHHERFTNWAFHSSIREKNNRRTGIISLVDPESTEQSVAYGKFLPTRIPDHRLLPDTESNNALSKSFLYRLPGRSNFRFPIELNINDVKPRKGPGRHRWAWSTPNRIRNQGIARRLSIKDLDNSAALSRQVERF